MRIGYKCDLCRDIHDKVYPAEWNIGMIEYAGNICEECIEKVKSQSENVGMVWGVHYDINNPKTIRVDK